MKGHTRSYTLKDGTEQWAAVFYTGKRFGRDGKIRDAYRWIRGFRTEGDADRELRKMLSAIDNETYVQPSKQNLAEYLEYWLNAAQPNLAPKTFERYKQLVEVNIKPKLGVINLI